VADRHDKLIESLGDKHEARLLRAIKRLEREVVRAANDAPTRGGRLYDARFAIQLRKELSKIFTEEYLSAANLSIVEYQEAVDSITKLFGELDVPLDLKQADKEVIQQLQKISFQGFQAQANTAIEELSDILYTSTVTGGNTADLVLSLQDALDKRLKRHAGQMVHDTLSQFDATLLRKFGEDTGAEKWKYTGTSITTTRKWCRNHIDMVMTEEEIREDWSKEWDGKAEGDPFVVRGGYNCRHRWRPVFE
jgi:hypothetical protein